MILCRTNRMLAGATLFVAVVAAVVPAEAEPSDKAASSAPVQIGRAAPFVEPIAVGNPVFALPLSRLSDTRDRPIFSPSRRPPPAPAPLVIAKPLQQNEPERPPFTLLGTVIGETGGIAVFIERATGTIVNLHTDESRQGWILHSVQGREATVKKDGESSVLAMAPPGSGADPASAQAYLQPIRRLPRR